jgi:hypothetical protein
MSVALTANSVTSETTANQAYNVVLDGVVALPKSISEKDFFDGLLDAVLAYVEQHQGRAGLSMSHQPYEDSNDYVDFRSDQQCRDFGSL